MGNASSSEGGKASAYSTRNFNASSDRGYSGLMEDIATANRLAPLYRNEDGWQLLFYVVSHLDSRQQGSYEKHARIAVRLNRCGADATVAQKLASRDTVGIKPLPYFAFQKVLKRMEADAEVAMAAQMQARGPIKPNKQIDGGRVLRKDGTLEEVEAPGDVSGDISNHVSGAGSFGLHSKSSPDSISGLGPVNDEVRKRIKRIYEAHNRDKLAGDHIEVIVSQYVDHGETRAEWEDLNRCLFSAYGEDLNSQGAVDVSRNHGSLSSPNNGASWVDLSPSKPLTRSPSNRSGGASPLTGISSDSTHIDTPPPKSLPGGHVVRRRAAVDCLICLEMTSSGISLPCLHGPFCEGCISVWTRKSRSCPCCRQGADDGDCWVHLEGRGRKQLHESLILYIKGLAA